MSFEEFRGALLLAEARAGELAAARPEGKPEEATKSRLLAPLLEALGYGPDDLTLDGAIPSLIATTEWVDYFLKPERTRRPWAMVEAKAIGDRDLWGRHKDQILRYMRNYVTMIGTDEPVRWIVLTNYREWHVVHLGEREPFWACTNDDLATEAVARRLYAILAREHVGRQRMLEFFQERQREDLHKRTAQFLADLKTWRVILANGIRRRHPELDLVQVKRASHELLLRFLLVRLLESNAQEPYFSLGRELVHWREQPRLPFSRHLKLYFEGLWHTYNTDLFVPSWIDSIDVPGDIVETIVVQDATPERRLLPLLGVRADGYRSIYNYDFSAMEHDVLGTAYEQFLAHELVETADGIAISESSETRKREGIYYTPAAVVDELVARTVAPAVQPHVSEALERLEANEFRAAHHAIDRVLDVKVLDPACGSGSFLIRAHQYIRGEIQSYNDAVDAILDARRNGPASATSLFGDEGATPDETPVKISSVAENVLLRCIHGVDIDAEAVGLARLALWTQLLTEAPGRYGRAGLAQAQLPNLALNIRHGNSLLDPPTGIAEQARIELASAARAAKDLTLPHPDRRAHLAEFDRRLFEHTAGLGQELRSFFANPEMERPFAWTLEFADVFDPSLPASARGFAVVIGNPPYFNVDSTFGAGAPMLAWLAHRFPSVYTDKTDVLFYFFARGLELLASGGALGFIVSRSFLQGDKSLRLRRHLAAESRIDTILDFLGGRVFGAGIATAVLTASRATAAADHAVEVVYVLDFPRVMEQLERRAPLTDGVQAVRVPQRELLDGAWVLSPYRETIFPLLDAHPPLRDLALGVGKGMETGENAVFVLTRAEVEALGLAVDSPLLRPLATNRNISAYRVLPLDEYVLWLEDASFEDLPEALRRHLERHRDALEARAAFRRGDCLWYRFSWPLHADRHFATKLMHSYRADGNGFVVDEDGTWLGLTNTIHVFLDRDGIDPYALCALLNSEAAEFRYRSLGGLGKATSKGMYEYFQHQIARMPVPQLDGATEVALASLGRRAQAGFAAVDGLHRALADALRSLPSEEVDLAVYLDPVGPYAHVAKVEAFDANDVGILYGLEATIDGAALLLGGRVGSDEESDRIVVPIARITCSHGALFQFLVHRAHYLCHHDATFMRRARLTLGASPQNVFTAALQSITLPRFDANDPVRNLGIIELLVRSAGEAAGTNDVAATISDVATTLSTIEDAAYRAFGVEQHRSTIERALDLIV